MGYRVITDRFHYLVGLDPEVIPPVKGHKLVFETDECLLDPGGVLMTRVPWTSFEVMGEKFCLQLYNCEMVLNRIDESREDLDGVATFYLHYAKMMMPVELCDALIEKVRELGGSSEAMHAELTYREAVRGVEETGSFIEGRGRTIKEIFDKLNELGSE